MGDPLTTGTFKFTKGISSGFLFKNLSGGEKAVFDLILDLVVARRQYDRTIYCIDEPVSRMNTRLQAELLSVLYDLTPDNCQLGLATHSIGMMRIARDIEASNPGSVCFLDFGSRDFDNHVTIEPAKPNRAVWQGANNVALEDLASLIAPSRVVICEGEPNHVVKLFIVVPICHNELVVGRYAPIGGFNIGSIDAVVPRTAVLPPSQYVKTSRIGEPSTGRHLPFIVRNIINDNDGLVGRKATEGGQRITALQAYVLNIHFAFTLDFRILLANFDDRLRSKSSLPPTVSFGGMAKVSASPPTLPLWGRSTHRYSRPLAALDQRY